MISSSSGGKTQPLKIQQAMITEYDGGGFMSQKRKEVCAYI